MWVRLGRERVQTRLRAACSRRCQHVAVHTRVAEPVGVNMPKRIGKPATRILRGRTPWGTEGGQTALHTTRAALLGTDLLHAPVVEDRPIRQEHPG